MNLIAVLFGVTIFAAGLVAGTVLATLAEGGWHRRTEVAEVTPEPSLPTNVRVLRPDDPIAMTALGARQLDLEMHETPQGHLYAGFAHFARALDEVGSAGTIKGIPGGQSKPPFGGAS